MSERLIRREKFKFQKKLIALSQEYLQALVGVEANLHWAVWNDYNKKWQRITNEYNHRTDALFPLNLKSFEIFCEKINIKPKIEVVL